MSPTYLQFILFFQMLVLRADSKSVGNIQVSEGGTANFFFTRSRNETSSQFQGYRLQKGEGMGTKFMSLPPRSDHGICILGAQEDIMRFCRGKCAMTKFNATNLLLVIYNVSQSDSAVYSCETLSGGFYGPEETEKFELTVRVSSITPSQTLGFINSTTAFVTQGPTVQSTTSTDVESPKTSTSHSSSTEIRAQNSCSDSSDILYSDIDGNINYSFGLDNITVSRNETSPTPGTPSGSNTIGLSGLCLLGSILNWY